MKALVVAPQPFFSPRGTPFSVYYRTLISAQLGVKIDLLTYGEGQDVDIPGVRIIRIPRFKLLGNVKIGPSGLKLFLDIFIVWKMIWLLLRNRYDVLHAHEEAVFIAYFLKPIFRFKLIYDMHSSLPQQLTNFKFSSSKWLIGLFKKLEDASLYAADGVITICPDLCDYVDTVITDKGKHFLIENSIFDKVQVVQPAAENGAESVEHDRMPTLPEAAAGKKVVLYAGTLEKYQGMDILIPAFKCVIDLNPQAFLLIVGGTPEQVAKYSQLAEKHKLGSHVHFTGRVPQVEAKYYNEIADVLTSPRSDGTNTPLKVYAQLASGKPLVATNIYSHTQVLNEQVCFLVDPQPEPMAKGILVALKKDEKTLKKVENAKRLYEEQYSRTIYTQKLENLFELLR